MSTLESLIYPVVDEINAGLEPESRLPKSPETPLIGRRATIDSIALVSLIASVEELIEDEQGLLVTLADERALARGTSPFRTLGTLAEYVDEVMDGQGNG